MANVSSFVIFLDDLFPLSSGGRASDEEGETRNWKLTSIEFQPFCLNLQIWRTNKWANKNFLNSISALNTKFHSHFQAEPHEQAEREGLENLISHNARKW